MIVDLETVRSMQQDTERQRQSYRDRQTEQEADGEWSERKTERGYLLVSGRHRNGSFLKQISSS